jgi:hypothetical protein
MLEERQRDHQRSKPTGEDAAFELAAHDSDALGSGCPRSSAPIQRNCLARLGAFFLFEKDDISQTQAVPS